MTETDQYHLEKCTEIWRVRGCPSDFEFNSQKYKFKVIGDYFQFIEYWNKRLKEWTHVPLSELKE